MIDRPAHRRGGVSGRQDPQCGRSKAVPALELRGTLWLISRKAGQHEQTLRATADEQYLRPRSARGSLLYPVNDRKSHCEGGHTLPIDQFFDASAALISGASRSRKGGRRPFGG